MFIVRGVVGVTLLGLLAVGFTFGFVSGQKQKAPSPQNETLATQPSTNDSAAMITNLALTNIVNVVENVPTNEAANTTTPTNTAVNSSVKKNTNTATKVKNTNTTPKKNKNTNTAKNANTNTAPTRNTNTVTNTTTNTNTTVKPSPGETWFSAYTTGYGWPDNTPPGGAVSNPVLHSTAGGTGTYSDPITVAVGHSIVNGKDILDYYQGTRFYVPTLRRYFIVEDTCGDGSQPQNGPCHTSEDPNHVQIDLWVGGQGASTSAVYNCESAITDVHLVIQNPAPNYSVVSGPVFNGSCSSLYGDTVVLK